MALPLIPLVAGAVLGSLATYLYKDDKLKRDLKRAAGNVSDKVSDGFEGLRDKVYGKTSSPSADEDSVAATPAAKKKASKKKAASKKATAKKAVSRKAPARKKAAAKATADATPSADGE